MEEKDYLDTLVDKLEALDLADKSYVNQLCKRLEPILEGMAPAEKEIEK